MRVLLLGHGRMGQLVESLAPSYGATIAGVIDEYSPDRAIADGTFGQVDVAIDFTLAEAVPRNLPRLADRGINVVIGTTGWHAHEAAMRDVAAKAGIGVLATSNFSLGMNVFQLVVEDAARRFAAHEDFGAWIHEAHHVMKKDAPSGTAITLQKGMEGAGYARPIDVSSTRAGSIPGTHTIGFDGPSETIALTHTVRDRAVFARGALVAAKWLVGKRGWFSMRDMLSGSSQEIKRSGE
jgi:4-hydroxy-tetrahydrodipicolinate reductase